MRFACRMPFVSQLGYETVTFPVMEHGLGLWCGTLFVHFMYLICSFHKILYKSAIAGTLYFGKITRTFLNDDVSTLEVLQPQLK